VAQLVYIPPHSEPLMFSTFVWLSWRVKVSTLAAASAVISSILDLRGFGATGGGSFFNAGSESASFLATGSESAPFLLVGTPLFFNGTLALAPGGFFRLADLLTLATGGAGFVGLALMDAVRLTTDGKEGSLSAGLRTRWTAGFRRFSESVEGFLPRGDGDLSRGLRARVLLCRPCLLRGDGLREVKGNFSPMWDNQALVGSRKPPFTLGSVVREVERSAALEGRDPLTEARSELVFLLSISAEEMEEVDIVLSTEPLRSSPFSVGSAPFSVGVPVGDVLRFFSCDGFLEVAEGLLKGEVVLFCSEVGLRRGD